MPFPEPSKTQERILAEYLDELDRLSKISYPLAFHEAKKAIALLETQIIALKEWIINLDDRFSAHENSSAYPPGEVGL